MPGPTSDIFPAITGSGSWVRRPTTQTSTATRKVRCARARQVLQIHEAALRLGTTAWAKPPKSTEQTMRRTMLALLDVLAVMLVILGAS